MKITIDLSEDRIAFLVPALDWPPSKTPEELAQAWLPLAVEAWLSWLSGEKRYNSLTEQYTDWIEKIYKDLLPTEAPSTERLFNSFNVPYGQAQYIARVLNNRETARWREQALDELKAELGKRKDDVYSWAPDRAEDGVDMVLSKLAVRGLDDTIDNLYRESPGEVDFRSRLGGSLTLVKIRINARTFRKVCEQLDI
jgi:hypothetical protein